VAQVERHQPVREWLTDAGDQLDRFHRSEAADRTRYRTEDRELTPPTVRWLRHAASQARRFARQYGGDLPGQLVHGAINHGFILPDALLVECEAFVEERGATNDHVRHFDEPFGVRERDVFGDGNNLDLWIQVAKPTSGTFDPGRADRRVRHQELAIQVTALDQTGMGEDDPTDTGCSEFVGGQATQSAGARNQDRCRLQLSLTHVADAGDPHLPLVGLELIGGQRLVWFGH